MEHLHRLIVVEKIQTHPTVHSLVATNRHWAHIGMRRSVFDFYIGWIPYPGTFSTSRHFERFSAGRSKKILKNSNRNGSILQDIFCLTVQIYNTKLYDDIE